MDIIRVAIPTFIKDVGPLLIKQFLGFSGGFYVWIVEEVLLKLWAVIEPGIERFMWELNKNKLDDIARKEYETLKKQGAPIEVLKKKRNNLLGTKP